MSESALLVPMPRADAMVREWRARCDPTAAVGIPAHVTLLYPLPAAAVLAPSIVTRCARLAASFPPFRARLGRFDVLPDGPLYLVPEPTEVFRSLVDATAALLPEYPQYGGAHAEVVPHLTVAEAGCEDRFDTIRADVGRRLPIAEDVSEIHLMTQEGRWRIQRVFPLRGGSGGARRH